MFYLIKRLLFLLVIVFSIKCNLFSLESHQSKSEKKIIGYYTGWSIYRTPSFKPTAINGSLLTHINYAFINLDKKGHLILFDSWSDIDYREEWNSKKPYWGNFYELLKLKKTYPKLKTLFSVGGYTLSNDFSEMAADPIARKNFIAQCIDFAKKYQFDGVDLDWEYPGFAEHHGRLEDKKNFTLLLKEFHEKIKATHPKLLLTIAAPAGPQHFDHIELNKIHRYIDWFNLMTYDFHGPWGSDSITHHNAPLYGTNRGHPDFNINSAVTFYLNQGVPSEKIMLGMPFYGRSFGNVEHSQTGLYSSYSEAGKGSTAESGILFFNDIKTNYLFSYQRFWDNQAKVPYLYNAKERQFISYDDEESLAIKCEYINVHQLGGAMIWELGEDKMPEWNLLKIINKNLKH